LGILLSGCSELPEKDAPVISRTLIEEKLSSLNLSDAPPQWITSSGKAVRRPEVGGLGILFFSVL
jgi:hypothetical protein